jgi:thymidylate synthase (FAD)
LDLPGDSYRWWETACNVAADMYLSMIRDGATPQAARSVLPNSTKTEIIVSGKLRWWEHMLKLRLDKAAHPQIRYLMEILNDEVKLI